MGILRVVLALAIMVGHYKLVFPVSELDAWFPWMQPGNIHGAVKVNSFFVISGFYTQMLLETKFTERSPLRFYLYRAIRLLPVYYVCLCFLLLLSLWAQSQGLTVSRLIGEEKMVSPLFWLKNLTLFAPGIFYVNNLHLSDVPFALALRQAWVLADEFVIILMVPFLLRRDSTFRWTLAVSALVALYYVSQGTVRDYLGASMIYFVLGAAGYKYYQRKLASRSASAASITIVYGLVALLAVMLLTYRLLENMLGLYGAYVFFMATVVACVPWIAAFTRHIHRDRAIGSLSYPMYLSHFLFFSLVEMYAIQNGFLFAVAGVLVFSVLAVLFIERPLIAYRRQKMG